MSHVVAIRTQVRDPIAIRAACQRQTLPEPTFGATRLFNAEATGWRVQLPQWRFPLVCDTPTGQVHYDNFQGRWGDQAHLDKFLQNYTVEKTRLEARKSGLSVIEQSLPDGSIKLTMQVGAAA